MRAGLRSIDTRGFSRTMRLTISVVPSVLPPSTTAMRASGRSAVPASKSRTMRSMPPASLRVGMATNRRAGCAAPTLVRIFVYESFPNGQEEDFEVEEIGPIADVIEVAKNPLVERRVSAPAVDLRPAGHARLHA